MPIERHTTPAGLRLHPLRASDLTASDIAASQGLDPFKSALQLYAEKTGLIDGQSDNPMMQRGRWMEASVIAALIDQHPELRVKYPLDIYVRDAELRLGCTPDAVAELRGSLGLINVQCKVVARPAFDRDWSDGPPIGYQLQTLCEGMLLDAAVSVIAALVIDAYSARLELFDVPRHEAAEAKVRAIATAFWENVRTGKRPAADYTRDAETVAAIFPTSEAEPVLDLAADNRLPELLAEREAAKASVKATSERLAAMDTEIKEKLGAHERASLPGWRVSWKTQHRKEQIIPASTFRVLRVNKEEAA